MKWIAPGVAEGSDGRVWCQGGSRSSRYARPNAKRRYETLDEAWRIAFMEFHRLGEMLTPYFCHPHVAHTTIARIRPHPNPWAFRPYLVKKVPHNGRKRVVCGGWHLAKRVHALPA